MTPAYKQVITLLSKTPLRVIVPKKIVKAESDRCKETAAEPGERIVASLLEGYKL